MYAIKNKNLIIPSIKLFTIKLSLKKTYLSDKNKGTKKKKVKIIKRKKVLKTNEKILLIVEMSSGLSSSIISDDLVNDL